MEETGEPFVWQLLLQAVLIAVNAVFACAEIALISINPAKLEKLASDGNRAAKRLLSLTAKPARFLATIQVGITLAGFLGSAFAAENFSGKLASALWAAGFPLNETTTAAASLVLVTLILSFFTLVLGELVPKRIAMHRAEKIAFAFSPLIAVIAALFAPIVWLLTKSTNGLLRLLGIDPDAEEQAVTEEEIRLLLDAGSRRGSIAAGEKEIINNVFEFNDKTAEEVMTHRRDAVILWLKDKDAEWERIIFENRHGYYPVCGRDADDIRGVLCARDYLGLRDKSRTAVMKTSVREAQLVPNTLAANVLFTRMQKRHNHFAVVIDEYGSVDGILTMNDLLEELVGDLAEGEVKAERPPIEKIGNGLWRVSGAASLDRLARETGAALPSSGDYDTFAGYVFTVLGRIPEDGEQAEFEDSGLAVRVTGIRDRRLESALVRKVRL
jgi:putative hemolysin